MRCGVQYRALKESQDVPRSMADFPPKITGEELHKASADELFELDESADGDVLRSCGGQSDDAGRAMVLVPSSLRATMMP